jgi:hypothetical protein
MKVKCIDNSGVYLTIGNKYKVYDETVEKFLIKNDNSFLKLYYKTRFKSKRNKRK